MPITITRKFSKVHSSSKRAVYSLAYLSQAEKKLYPFQNTKQPKGTLRKDRRLESLPKSEYTRMTSVPSEFMAEDYLWFTLFSGSRKAGHGKFSIKLHEEGSTMISAKNLPEYPALANLAKGGARVFLRLDHVHTFVHKSTPVLIFKVSTMGQREEFAPVQTSFQPEQEEVRSTYQQSADQQETYCPPLGKSGTPTPNVDLIKHTLVWELLDLGKGGDAAVRLDAIKTVLGLLDQTQGIPMSMEEISGTRGKGGEDLLVDKVKSTNILENKRATKTGVTPMEMVTVRKVRGTTNLGSKNRLILEREDGKVAVIPKGKGGRNYQSVSFEMGPQKIPAHLTFQTPVKLQILSYQPARKGGYEVLAKVEDGTFRKGTLWGTAIIGTLDKSGAPTPYADITQPYWIVPRQYEFQRLVECVDPRLSTQAIPQRWPSY